MSSPAWPTASRECANRRASPISDQITTEVNAPMPYSAAIARQPGWRRANPISSARNGSIWASNAAIIDRATVMAWRAAGLSPAIRVSRSRSPLSRSRWAGAPR